MSFARAAAILRASMSAKVEGLVSDERGTTRCAWCSADDTYRRYHDREWGFPVVDDQRLFEKICLEGFQAGLSWLTILRKRDNFRRAFREFDFERLGSTRCCSTPASCGSAARSNRRSTPRGARASCATNSARSRPISGVSSPTRPRGRSA